MIKIYKKYGYPILLAINALLLYVYLFKAKVVPLGWDTQFHLNRIEELYRSDKQDMFFLLLELIHFQV